MSVRAYRMTQHIFFDSTPAEYHGYHISTNSRCFDAHIPATHEDWEREIEKSLGRFSVPDFLLLCGLCAGVTDGGDEEDGIECEERLDNILSEAGMSDEDIEAFKEAWFSEC